MTVGQNDNTLNVTNRGRFGRFLNNNSYLLFAFMCSTIVMLLVFYCFDLRPFGDMTILRMDLYHQYGPLFAELYERVKSGGSLLYSWNTGGGGAFLGNFFNYLASPLAIVIFLYDHVDLPDAIALMILLKAAFASAAFAFYLNDTFGKKDHFTAAFGVFYSFCGFFIAYYWNVMWLDAMALFPLVITGINRIIEQKKYKLYLFSLAVIMVSNYYMAFMVCIFSVLYFLYRYFSVYKLTATYSGKTKAGLLDRARDSRFTSSSFIFGMSSGTAALLALFALLPTYFILSSCSATSGSFPEEYKSYYSIFDFLANHLASVEPTIRSSGDDVLPNVYCGILTLILVPLYLLTKSISVKEKSLSVVLLGIVYFSFNTNYLNFIWHGFHFPNDLPYRFSFMYSFLLLTLAFKALIRIREFSGKEVFLSGLGVTFFIIMVQEIGSKNVDEATVLISLAFAVIYTLLLVLMRNKKYQMSTFALLTLCCVISEAAIANTDNYSMNQSKANYASDYKYFDELKSEIDSRDSDFYRMELTNLRTRMDPAWYNYHGLSTFSSMASESLSNLQSYMGMYGNFINSYTYNPQTPVYNAMMSLKYVVKKVDSDSLNNPDFYTHVYSNDTFTAYQNNYCLPIAYFANNSIVDWNIESGNPFEVQQDFFEKASGVGNVFTNLMISDIDYSNVNDFYTGFDTGEFSFSKIDSNASGSVTMSVTVEKTQNCYVYVKSRSVDSITVSHSSFEATQTIDEAYILDVGICNKGETIDVEIPIKDDASSGTIKFFVYGVENDSFVEGFNVLNSCGLDVELFKDTHITGSFTAPEDGILFTSITYDEGWQAYIDGVKVSVSNYVKIGNALLGIRVAEGDHTLELKYEPQGFYLSCTVSVITFAILMIFIVITYSRKRKKAAALAELMLETDTDFDFLPVERNEGFYVDRNAVTEIITDSVALDDGQEETVLPLPLPYDIADEDVAQENAVQEGSDDAPKPEDL